LQGFIILLGAFIFNVKISTKLTYLYLSEDQDSTFHQVESDFWLPVRYYRVPST
jgi:hypothetical protein